MATSGTYTFAVSANDLVAAAFRGMQIYGANDAGPTTNDTTVAMQALNIITKAMAMKGLPLWCVQELPIPMLAGVATYALSQRALRITYAYLRNASGTDVEVAVYSRYDYDQLGQKSSTGVVNQLFYDYQIASTGAPPGIGSITVYDVPADSTTTLYLVIQRSLQDFAAVGNNPDFPQEAYLMLKWALMAELCLEYEVSKDKRDEINMKALLYQNEFFGSAQEQVSVTFAMNNRGR